MLDSAEGADLLRRGADRRNVEGCPGGPRWAMDGRWMNSIGTALPGDLALCCFDLLTSTSALSNLLVADEEGEELKVMIEVTALLKTRLAPSRTMCDLGVDGSSRSSSQAPEADDPVRFQDGLREAKQSRMCESSAQLADSLRTRREWRLDSTRPLLIRV